MNRYSLEWYDPRGVNGWHCIGLYRNKRLARTILRTKWEKFRGKFPFRLIDAGSGALIQKRSRIA